MGDLALVGWPAVSPANAKPVRPWTPDRHIDINADLHYFFDWLVTGKTVLDVGAGLGKSKARIRHSRVTTYDPSPAVADRVDRTQLPTLPLRADGTVDHRLLVEPLFDVVTAFEVIEHVEADQAFCQTLDSYATQAVFLTTPNWDVAKCQSADHYREYTCAEWEELICGTFPDARWRWGAYYKDAEGGWCELLSERDFHRRPGLKHLALVDKGLSEYERRWLDDVEDRARG